MDDIIISGNDNGSLEIIVAEVKSSADRAGFVLNKKKEEGPSPKITAFNIEITTGILEIKLARYRTFQENYRSTSNPRVKKGIETYITSVNTDQLAGL